MTKKEKRADPVILDGGQTVILVAIRVSGILELDSQAHLKRSYFKLKEKVLAPSGHLHQVCSSLLRKHINKGLLSRKRLQQTDDM